MVPTAKKPFSRFQIQLQIYVVVGVVFWIYWATISTPRLSDFDDKNVIAPLANVHSISEYIKLCKENVILDRQPLRDLTYIAEFRIRDLSGFYDPQFINVLFWLATLAALSFVLSEIGASSTVRFALTMAVAAHPVAVNSVAWATGRKHILSALFIMLATLFWLRARRLNHRGWLALSFYLCSCFTQPINILWSVWAAAVSKKEQRKVLVLLLFSMVLVALMNLQYYSGHDYAVQSGGPKFSQSTSFVDSISNRLLAVGRYAYQIFVPTHSSYGPYDQLTQVNLYGLPIAALAAFLFFRKRRDWMTYCWFAFSLFPLAVVVLPTTEHLGWDTYLLTPLLGTAILFAAIITSWPAWSMTAKLSQRNRQLLVLAGVVGLTLLTAGFAYRSHEVDRHWTDDEQMWFYSLRADESHIAVVANAKMEIGFNDAAGAEKLTEIVERRWPGHKQLGYLKGRLLFMSHRSNEEKARLFESQKIESFWYDYYWSVFEASTGDYEQAEKRLRSILDSHTEVIVAKIREQNSELFATWFAVCELSHKSDCREKLKSWRSSVPDVWWNEKIFRERFERLAKKPYVD